MVNAFGHGSVAALLQAIAVTAASETIVPRVLTATPTCGNSPTAVFQACRIARGMPRSESPSWNHDLSTTKKEHSTCLISASETIISCIVTDVFCRLPALVIPGVSPRDLGNQPIQ